MWMGADVRRRPRMAKISRSRRSHHWFLTSQTSISNVTRACIVQPIAPRHQNTRRGIQIVENATVPSVRNFLNFILRSTT